MRTQEEVDDGYAKWLTWVDAAIMIRARIMDEGDMATKTRVEDELMPMFGIDRYAAHSIMNHVELNNLKVDHNG